MKKHFVEFFSPGTLFSEVSKEEIKSWDVDKAVEMAKNIKERHGATPYGFQFVTRERGPKDFNSKETKRSNTYFLGGKLFTLAQVKARNDPADKILISNMEINGYKQVIENNNSWKATLPFNDGDILLEFTPTPTKKL